MITLNLISEKKRGEIEMVRQLAYAKTIAIAVLCTLLLAAGFLFGIQAILENRLTAVREEISSLESQLPERGSSSLDQNTKALNAQLKRITDLNAMRISIPVLLDRIAHAVPGGITLEAIGAKPLTKQLTLTGIAATRNDLLTFQNSLTALPYIAGIDTPLSTFTQRENIPFNFTATLLTEKILEQGAP